MKDKSLVCSLYNIIDKYLPRLFIMFDNLKTIRYYGFYSSKKHPLYEMAKKLIDKTKNAFYKFLTKWRNLIVMSFGKAPLKCSCGTIMEFQYRVPRME